MKLLVTGGSGFVGTNLIEFILENNPEAKILNIDNLSNRAHTGFSFVPHTSGRYVFHQADLTDAKAVAEIFRAAKPTHVVHLAKAGVDGLKNVLEQCNRLAVNKFVYVSPPCVVGSSESAHLENEMTPPQEEDAGLAVYQEAIVRDWRSLTNDYNIVRAPRLYGKYQQLHEFVPTVIGDALKGMSPPIDENATRTQWMFVNDFSNALHCALLKGERGHTYNVGNGSVITDKQIAEIIRSKMGCKQSDLTLICDEFDTNLPFHYAMTSTKMESLGFEPVVDLNFGLDFTILWYKKNVFLEGV